MPVLPVLPVSEPACVQVWASVSDDGVQQVSAAEEAEPGCDDVSAVAAAELEPLRKNRDSKRQLT